MNSTADRLAAAALAILVSEGADAVTMRRVAADAGVTTMATYRHYPNREALLRNAVDSAIGSITTDWDSSGDDFFERTWRLLTQFLDFALGQPNLYTFLVAERWPAARQFPADFQTGGSPAFAPMFRNVSQGMHDGVLRRDDVLEVTLALTTPIMGLLQQYLNGRIAMPEPEFRALCRRTIERVLNGLH